jgi:hypothetical protein
MLDCSSWIDWEQELYPELVFDVLRVVAIAAE